MTLDLLRVASAFDVVGQPVGVTSHRGGHIHRSWVVACSGGSRYFLQALNTAVFSDPAALMSNVVRVTVHLRAAGEPTIRVVGARDGSSWWQGPDGQAWRAFVFLEGASSQARVTSPVVAAAVGAAFGRFAGALATLPDPPLAVTITRFHDLRYRWEQLAGAGAGAGPELAALYQFEPLIQRWHDPISSLPQRVAHNDAKADNVLLDDTTGSLRAVVDLDTVMPGTILSDLGDLIRSTACPAAEDETDLERVRIDDELFEAVITGYARAAGDRITGQELSCALLAAQCITFEQAVRFLTDHLSGDRYYRVTRPGHNLDRARNQLKLVEELTTREDQLSAIAASAIRAG
jgi:Ser/Thr protein kinase RdoA (MazF antagonist)